MACHKYREGINRNNHNGMENNVELVVSSEVRGLLKAHS